MKRKVKYLEPSFEERSPVKNLKKKSEKLRVIYKIQEKQAKSKRRIYDYLLDTEDNVWF